MFVFRDPHAVIDGLQPKVPFQILGTRGLTVCSQVHGNPRFGMLDHVF